MIKKIIGFFCQSKKPKQEQQKAELTERQRLTQAAISNAMRCLENKIEQTDNK